MNNAMTNTPRTDKYFGAPPCGPDEIGTDDVEFARTLERETVALKAQLAEVTKERDLWATMIQPKSDTAKMLIEARSQLSACQRDRQRAVEALRLVFNNGRGSEVFPNDDTSHPDCSWIVRFRTVESALSNQPATGYVRREALEKCVEALKSANDYGKEFAETGKWTEDTWAKHQHETFSALTAARAELKGAQ